MTNSSSQRTRSDCHSWNGRSQSHSNKSNRLCIIYVTCPKHFHLLGHTGCGCQSITFRPIQLVGGEVNESRRSPQQLREPYLRYKQPTLSPMKVMRCDEVYEFIFNDFSIQQKRAKLYIREFLFFAAMGIWSKIIEVEPLFTEQTCDLCENDPAASTPPSVYHRKESWER